MKIDQIMDRLSGIIQELVGLYDELSHELPSNNPYLSELKKMAQRLYLFPAQRRYSKKIYKVKI